MDASDATLGEAHGEMSVTRHFPSAHKARIEAMTARMPAAMGRSIDGLDWIGVQSKQQSRAKFATFRARIGHRGRWTDRPGIEIDRDDLAGNMVLGAATSRDTNSASSGAR